MRVELRCEYVYTYFSVRNNNNKTLSPKRGSSSVSVDSLEPQAMAALRSESPMSHSGTPVVEPIEVEQHLIGTSATDEEPPPDPGVAVDATSPLGIPLIPLPIPSTISEANFQRMMDFGGR